MLENNFVWIFNGNLRVGRELPSGVFLSKEKAQKWVEGLDIKGQLTPYPVDTSVYDWAVKNKFFTPQVPEHSSPAFIASFIVNYYEKYIEWVEQIITNQTITEAITQDESESQTGATEGNLKLMDEVWVYNAYAPQRSGLASAVFRTKDDAEKWVKGVMIEGLLTAYPVDICAYDYYVQNGWFTPKKPHHSEPYFIGTFTGGRKHFHFDLDKFGKPGWV